MITLALTPVDQEEPIYFFGDTFTEAAIALLQGRHGNEELPAAFFLKLADIAEALEDGETKVHTAHEQGDITDFELSCHYDKPDKCDGDAQTQYRASEEGHAWNAVRYDEKSDLTEYRCSKCGKTYVD